MKRVEPGQMPDFHHWISTCRSRHHLTIETAAVSAGITVSHLNKIEYGRRHPSRAATERLMNAYDLDSWQRRHTLDLWAPSQNLTPVEDLRRHLTTPAVHAHLDHLDARGVLAVYVDPLGTVLAANHAFHQTFPGLDDLDGSLPAWFFTPAARAHLPQWDFEAAHCVAILRGTLGRYRDTPDATRLLRKLRRDDDFTRLWADYRVAYGRRATKPIQLRPPHCDATVDLSFQVSEFARPDILITYGVCDHPAIAC
ncbi:helix-turn-helix domain-containing protein [Nocardia wallacei]|uniref:MmyB family transcriptional regulator n=1 Tax=Nocardia wallacei TaxID=480035 RepID=UPI002455847E|nr:helix-turn-helix domain-containing protein [Nocardia wallacei]